MKNSRERGFTLIEVLVVTMLGTLLAVGTFKIINLTQRIHTTQAAQVQGQQALRAGIAMSSVPATVTSWPCPQTPSASAP